ncbi:MAG: cysteine desulfurase [candidate division WOR-3 bacterium]|jgi:cysteine desulfurase|nr:cysteine desulfurase [candidate division WOR-3 bacterium]MCR4424508.1 cysteine desulfurase [candidate division WOR-3 bacterium]MDH7519644.1 cysteine desulfurase family protein [bacterium]
MKRRVYLDNNSTTPIDPRVRAAIEPYLNEVFGNPSNLHCFGRDAAEGIARAREQVADFLNARPEEIFFTSGGTEANNWAVKGVAVAQMLERGRHIVTSPIEHASILGSVQYLSEQGWQVTYLPVDSYGVVDPAAVQKALTKQTVLVSVMLANNEIGTIEPIKEIAAVCKNAGVLFHTDAVAAAGKMKIDVRELGVDLLTISGHKIHAPKGVGVLFIREGVKIHPLIHGGHHEKGRRAGTENIIGIVAMGTACTILKNEWQSHAAKMLLLRRRLEEEILSRVPDVRLNGHPENRLVNTSHFSVAYVEGEALLMNLDLEGIAVASGSACSSGEPEPSPTVKAINIPPLFRNSVVRFSLGKETTEEDIDYTVAVFERVVKRLRDISPLKGSS